MFASKSVLASCEPNTFNGGSGYSTDGLIHVQLVRNIVESNVIVFKADDDNIYDYSYDPSKNTS